MGAAQPTGSQFALPAAGRQAQTFPLAAGVFYDRSSKVETKVDRLARGLQAATTVFLFLFVVVQPASIAATHIAYAAAAVMWLLRLLLVRSRGLHGGPLDLPILIYLVVCAISATQSPLPVSSWEGMLKVLLVCVVLIFSQNVPTLARGRQLVTVLILSSLVSVGWSFWMYSAGVGLHVTGFGPDPAWYTAGLRKDDVILRVDGRRLTTPQQFLAYLNSKPPAEPLQLGAVPVDGIEVSRNARPVTVPPGVWHPADNLDQLGVTVEKARPVRAFGFYSHYVTYSMVLALLASLMFGLWLSHRKRLSPGGLLSAAAFLAFALALGMTLTRAAWAALILACAVQLWFHFRQKMVRLLLPVALVLALLAAGAVMVRWRGASILDLRDPGTDYRILMWKDGLRLIREHPWFGIGMNSVRDAWWRFDLAAYQKYPLRSHFHSTPMQIAVESGLPALLAWIFFMATYGKMLVQLVARARDEPDRWSYGFALGALGGTTGFLASSLVHYDFGDSVVMFLFWFLAGMALAVRRQLAQKEMP
jgi:O-antigen ligase